MKNLLIKKILLIPFFFYTTIINAAYDLEKIGSCTSNKVYVPQLPIKDEVTFQAKESHETILSFSLYSYKYQKTTVGILSRKSHNGERHTLFNNMSFSTADVIIDKESVSFKFGKVFEVTPEILNVPEEYFLSISKVKTHYASVTGDGESFKFMRFFDDEDYLIGALAVNSLYLPAFFKCN